MTTDYTPEPIKTLTDLEAIKVISDPKRLEILEIIRAEGKALSVKQMAEQLKVDPRKLYYHIKLLEQHEILVVAETQIVANIAEKFYHLAAYTYEVSPTLFALEGEENPMQKTLELIFDHTKAELIKSAHQGLIKHGEKPPTSNIGRATFRLNSEQIFEFIEGLHHLIQRFDTVSSEEDKDRALYLFSFAFFPTVSNELDDEDKL